MKSFQLEGQSLQIRAETRQIKLVLSLQKRLWEAKHYKGYKHPSTSGNNRITHPRRHLPFPVPSIWPKTSLAPNYNALSTFRLQAVMKRKKCFALNTWNCLGPLCVCIVRQIRNITCATMPKFQIGSIQREQKDKIGFLEAGEQRAGRGFNEG